MKQLVLGLLSLLLILLLITSVKFSNLLDKGDGLSLNAKQAAYWFVLYRKSNREELYKGIPGDKEKSSRIRDFQVKTGIPGERPTPLPQLLGRDYWVITEKHEELNNPETAPYFLTLNIPTPSQEPFGPVPYKECNGQCSWILPGAFGLHGSGGDVSKLSPDDPGSSGCIRHSDEDIIYLYDLLEPQKEEIRYYIEDT